MKRVAPLLGLAMLVTSTNARAVGEEINGFPSWAERVEHEWTNRARVDPAYEMGKCPSGNCPDASCYTAKPPLYWAEYLNHAARYHSSEMKVRGFFAHDSNCALVSTLKDSYPSTCKGEVSCACSGGTLSGSTNFAARIGIFGSGGASGEIIAGGSDPNSAFYLWLFEHATDASCKFTTDKGHRWLILTSNGSVGYGVEPGGNSTGDFGGGGAASKIASGSHYPRSGASVDLWANWYDTAGPSSALVNVGGTCHPMTLGHGTVTNGAYSYTATGLSGCQRYYFRFKDSTGAVVDWPTTGSLGIGDATCADWDATRPASGSGCDCTPSCGSKKCGDDGCGGSCGTCASTETCSSAGACVAKPPPPMDAGPPMTDSGMPAKDSGTSAADSGPAKPDSGSIDEDTGGSVDVDATAPSEDGSIPISDSSITSTDDPSASPSGDVQGSCGCRVRASRSDHAGLVAIALGLLLWRRKR